MPKQLMNWFERRVFLKRLAAAGSRAVGASAFAIESPKPASHMRVPDDPRSLLEATEWRTYSVFGPGEDSAF